MIVNHVVSIQVENPGSLQRADTQEDEDEEAIMFEVAKSSSKVLPGVDPEEAAAQSEESSPEDEVEAEKRLQELMLREKREIEKKKKLKAFKRRRSFINCLRKVVCFKDDQDAFDEVSKIPTCKQVCCWRLLRARRRSHRFHASQESLTAFEKSKYQSFVSILISVNYFILYGVLLYPFLLIAQEKWFNDAEESCIYGVDEAGECLTEDDTMPVEDLQKESGLTFNEIMLIVNGGVLLYQLICELIMIAV